ncbi:autotransporter-like protein [Novosphingobium sp. PhB165]|uniref:autotransporter outer membrane beta-barrel domain-containing protein n=1 Tax=Novosphingobium sp. PhB165 TaxID=2485105 RepID=UPI00104C4018|nr:autotransporter outer membrane beta-barrel domain-containing protein [Novosphingobium sp. PhB165]TCM17820.1 autotransporter-like protein [Novosphingobium sp. PhB165]
MRQNRMAGPLLAASLALAAIPAQAQDTAGGTTPVVTAVAALPTSTTVSAETQADTPAPDKPWSFALAAGVSDRDHGSDGSWQSMALSRQVGRGYVRAALMRYHGTLLQANTALPSDYLVGTIGAGGNFDNWVVDGWASYGWQDYGRISTDAGKRDSTGATGSPYYSVGGDFGRVFPLGDRIFATPTVTMSYAHGRLLHPAPDETGLVDLETEEPTWSSAATLRIDHAFGSEGKQYVGLSIARAWTSNAVSEVLVRDYSDVLMARQTGVLPARHLDDGWWEIGATANMRLSDSMSLDLYATRSFEALAGNTTSAGISLRRSF